MFAKKRFGKIKKFFSKRKWLKKTEGWIWLVLLVATIIYFKWSLIEAGLATDKLIGERQQFRDDLEKQQMKNQKLQQEMQAQISSPMRELIGIFQNINSHKINTADASSTENECSSVKVDKKSF